MHRTPVPEHVRDKPATASERQLKYIRDLMEQRDISKLPDDQRVALQQPDEFWDEDTTRLTKMKAGRIIDALKKLPYMPNDRRFAKRKFPEVKDGRYALSHADGNLRFYSVKVGNFTTFVDVWASDSRWPIKNNDEKLRILTEIFNDPDAGPRFGREIGRCYVCGRTLTDATSRRLGIGPICRGDE